jgi:DNA-binding MarR family transcriptional regulator
MTSLIQQYLKQQRDFKSVEQEVFVGLQLVADRLTEPWARLLKERADLTLVQYNVLRILRGAGSQGLRASEIGERLITRSPDITRILDRMEIRGLVRREPDPHDRRAVRIQATEGGLERIAPFDVEGHDLLTASLQDLGDERLLALRDALDAILGSLERHR